MFERRGPSAAGRRLPWRARSGSCVHVRACALDGERSPILRAPADVARETYSYGKRAGTFSRPSVGAVLSSLDENRGRKHSPPNVASVFVKPLGVAAIEAHVSLINKIARIASARLNVL